MNDISKERYRFAYSYHRPIVQIVGYDASAPGMYITRAETQTGSPDESSEVEFISLAPGSELAYTLGQRHCAGVITDNGHHACTNTSAPYCQEHHSTWVCAKCTGTCLKDEMDCYESHAIYLAVFAPDIHKIGVTKQWRLTRRLAEQGADYGIHLQTVSNGRIAREHEAAIATAASITDRIRAVTKHTSLYQDVDESAIAAQLANINAESAIELHTGSQLEIGEYIESLPKVDVSVSESMTDTRENNITELKKNPDPPAIYRLAYGFELSDRPVSETIITGTVRGIKGRLIILDYAGSTYTVDMRDLVGYTIASGATTRNLQASLGAWE